MQAEELIEIMKDPQAPLILDVRSSFEFKAGHIPGAVHSPSWRILLSVAPLPAEKDTRMVVTCEHGPRAQVAKSILGLIGYKSVSLLDGHMAGWRRKGLPLEK